MSFFSQDINIFLQEGFNNSFLYTSAFSNFERLTYNLIFLWLNTNFVVREFVWNLYLLSVFTDGFHFRLWLPLSHWAVVSFYNNYNIYCFTYFMIMIVWSTDSPDWIAHLNLVQIGFRYAWIRARFALGTYHTNQAWTSSNPTWY